MVSDSVAYYHLNFGMAISDVYTEFLLAHLEYISTILTQMFPPYMNGLEWSMHNRDHGCSGHFHGCSVSSSLKTALYIDFYICMYFWPSYTSSF